MCSEWDVPQRWEAECVLFFFIKIYFNLKDSYREKWKKEDLLGASIFLNGCYYQH